METIESLVSELNDLCKCYIAEKEEFKDLEKIRKVVLKIKDIGYNIVSPLSELTLPEYDLLTNESKQDFTEMTEIKRLKMDAIEKQEFERAADLRDEERKFILKIKIDFLNANQNQHFIVAGKCSDLILFNDPDNFLIALFKK